MPKFRFLTIELESAVLTNTFSKDKAYSSKKVHFFYTFKFLYFEKGNSGRTIFKTRAKVHFFKRRFLEALVSSGGLDL